RVVGVVGGVGVVVVVVVVRAGVGVVGVGLIRPTGGRRAVAEGLAGSVSGCRRGCLLSMGRTIPGCLRRAARGIRWIGLSRLTRALRWAAAVGMRVARGAAARGVRGLGGG
ncbi:hypothetical protein C8A00DRAFT_35519, partial [Chaetomidium leptoderma]